MATGPLPYTPPPYERQPLGLPAGSVRALLALTVLGLIWALMAMPEEKNIKIPLYLYYLMFLVLGHFFAAHGHSIAGPRTGGASPLYLPRGSLRFLIILGFLAVLGWRYYRHPDPNDFWRLQENFTQEPYLPLVLVGGFFLGVFMGRVVGRMLRGPQGVTPWFQDIQAWLALLATVGLGIEVLLELVINPSMPEDQRINVPHFQAALATIIAFYFGVRS